MSSDEFDKRFVDEIYDPYLGLLLHYFKQQGCDPEDSWDYAHETLIRAYKAYSSFDGKYHKAWIMKIAARIWLNVIRSEKPTHMQLPEMASEKTRSLQERQVILNETQAVVKEAINDLPQQMKTVVKMRHFQDLSYKEISQVSKLNINTVKSHLSQAKQKLKKKLKQYVRLDK